MSDLANVKATTRSLFGALAAAAGKGKARGKGEKRVMMIPPLVSALLRSDRIQRRRRPKKTGHECLVARLAPQDGSSTALNSLELPVHYRTYIAQGPDAQANGELLDSLSPNGKQRNNNIQIKRGVVAGVVVGRKEGLTSLPPCPQE